MDSQPGLEETTNCPLTNDDVTAFKCFFDEFPEKFPEFISLVGKDGRNVLQILILRNRPNIFSYLLSLNCFDLEATDDTNETVLCMVLSHYIPREISSFYATKLIDAGANIKKICKKGNTYLHLAVSNSYFEVAKILIQKGAEINAQDDDGRTPLHKIPISRDNDMKSELLGLALYHGTDPHICDNNGYIAFDHAVFGGLELSALENLFYYTFDSHSKYELSSRVLCRLIGNNSPLLGKVIGIASEVILEEDEITLFGFIDEFSPVYLFDMESDYLKVMIEKFSSFIRDVLNDYVTMIYLQCFHENIDNWNLLLNSKLRSETIEFIMNLYVRFIILYDASKKEVTAFIFYLLTFGLDVEYEDYQDLYKTTGYSDLFKTMLHMDYTSNSRRDMSIVKIICDIHCDLENFLPHLDSISSDDLEELLQHFANPVLRNFCERSNEPKLIAKAEQLTRVPSLVELARNATRRHLVNRFKLKKASQYYSLLKWLKIGGTYERILSFETKLYE